MADLRFTDTNAGDDSAGRAFGLEGNLYLPLVGGVVIGIGFAAAALFLGVGLPAAVGLGLTPPLGITAWVLGLRHGRPAGYDRDWIDNWLGASNLSPGHPKSDTTEHADAPEARFVGGMLIFGSPEKGGLAAKGFRLERPDLRGASYERLNAMQVQVKAMLAQIGSGRRLQIQWWADADYRQALLNYRARTVGIKHPAIQAVRNSRFARYWPRIAAGTLRREHLVVFLSIELAGNLPPLASRDRLMAGYGAVLDQATAQFEEFEGFLRTELGTETTVSPLDDLEHFALVRRFLNPSLTCRSENDPAVQFDPERSLQENCWHGEGVGQSSGGFYLDGHYHAILALSRWPQRTRPGIVTHLTGLPFLDYAVTVNVVPIPGRREIRKEEQAAERLRGEYSSKPRASLLVALRKKERKVEALAGGFARPFAVTYLIRVWAPTTAALREKVAAVQAAVNAMDGAQCFEGTLPTTAKKLFFASWPGWTHSSYRHRELYAEDAYLADVLPFSATFTGDLEGAEALYDGSHGNMVGVATAVRGSPQHAVILGMTGAGKSAFVEDLLFQTAGEFSHTLLVEEGLSYSRFTAALGEKPIVLHPDTALSLNYLDTQGLPLTQLHLATAVALLARMVGVPEDPEALTLRQAQLAQYLQLLYEDTFADWVRRHPEQAEVVRRMACATHGWRERQNEATWAEAFIDLRDRLTAGDDEAQSFVEGIAASAVTRFAQEPATARLVVRTACAYYRPEEYPTHGALVELLAFGRMPEHGADEIGRLATLLRAWTAEGPYGRLFDGVTSVSFKRRVVHFELGSIPEQAVELKAAAGLLISGLGRQHILALPRAERKRILFEELGRFLDTPGGEEIVAEGYAQLRKHNCWCASVIQQYARFRSSRVRGAVIGNAKRFFFLRQADRADLVDLAQDLPVPEAAIEAIQRYPLPEQLPAETRHSSVCYFSPTAQPPACGTIRHYQEVSCAS